MQRPLRVRDASPVDAPLLTQWARAMALETEGRELDEVTVSRGIAQGIGDRALARYFVAVRDVPLAGDEMISEPVGMLMLTSEWSDWRCGHWWWIQSVYVAPTHRRAGVYRALHDHVRQLAEQQDDVIGLRLYVEHANDAAQATYAALGMQDAGYRIYEAGVSGR